MKKSLLCIILITTLIFIGCGGKQKAEATSTEFILTETTEQTSTETETTSIETESTELGTETTSTETEFIEKEQTETELPVVSTDQTASTNPNNANIPKEDYQWYRDTFGLTDEQIANLTQEEHDKMVVDWFNSLGGSGSGGSSSSSSGSTGGGTSSGSGSSEDELWGPVPELIPDDEVDAGHM